ncbi:MAG: ribosome silencing factor [Vicinamibacterales bacterium]
MTTSSASPSSPRLPKALKAAVAAAQDRQAQDLVVLDLRKVGGFTDYFLICTGQNTRQIGAIADAIEAAVKEKAGERPALIEGRGRAEWVLLDYFSFVVHVFSRDARAFYDLERLWGNAKRHELPG